MIDRDPETEEFIEFLDPQSQDWLMVFYGQNGIGKTTLLTSLAARMESGCAVAWLDFCKNTDMQWSCRAVLDELSQTLQHFSLPADDWEKYRNEQNKLDDWSAEKKVSVDQRNEAQNNSIIRNTSQVVNINLAKELLHFEQEADLRRASAWLDLASKLAPRLVIFVDHWDLLALKGEPVFRRWFLENLLLDASRRLPGFRAVLASDRPFNEAGFITGIRMVKLNPLIDTFSLALLEQEGIDNPQVRADLCQLLEGNPLLLKLAGKLYHNNPRIDLLGLRRCQDIQAKTKWLLNRTGENFPDEISKKALERGVILDSFNLEMIQSICEIKGLTAEWWHDFRTNPFLVDNPARDGYMEFVRTVREYQISWLWTQQSEEFKRLHGIALNWYRQNRISVENGIV